MIVLATAVGSARGAMAAAAALACAGSEADRASLLIGLDVGRPPRPSLIATAPARALEERLAAHLPEAAVASRGRICQLTLSSGSNDAGAAIERIATALPLVRDSLAVIHLSPARLQAALAEPRLRPSGALLRAELAGDRALTALAVGDLMARDIEVVVVKRPLGWAAGRAALLGLLPQGVYALPARAGRLLP